MVPRGSHSGSVRVALLLALLVVCGAVSPAAAATTRVDATDATDAPNAPNADRCFPPGGWEFVVGTEGPQIRFVVHLSLLSAVVEGDDPTNGTEVNVTGVNASLANGTDSVAAGAFGIEAVATTETDRIVSLQAGVLFGGVESPTPFLANPFSPFAFVFDYHLTIPAFEGTVADPDYHTGDVPVSGPVEEASCSR